MNGTDADSNPANALAPASTSEALRRIVGWIQKYNVVLVFLILLLVSSSISDVFFTERNLMNLLRQLSGVGIISMGVLLVIMVGGIDLSVGSVLALGSVLSAFTLTGHAMPLPAALAVTVLAGAMAGGLSGYLVSMRGVAAFIATLAVMTIARGVSFIVSKGAPIPIDNAIMIDYIGNGYILNVPIPVVLLFLAFAATLFLLRYTVWGRMVTAIGSNEAAVAYAGVRVAPYKFAVFVVSGCFAALAGIVSTARTGVGSPLVGVGIELDAIAAVVVGGASLNGGKGTALNTLLGVFIIGMIGNIMNLLNVPAYPQQVIKGCIIILAVLVQGMKPKHAY